MGSPTRFFPCPYFGCKCKRDRSCLSALLSTWTWAVEDCICTASKQACFALSEFLLFAHASCFWFRKGNLGVIQGSNGQVASTSVFFISFPKLSLMLALQAPLETWRTRGLSPLSARCCSYPAAADWGLAAKTRICWYKGVRPCPECDESAHVCGIYTMDDTASNLFPWTLVLFHPEMICAESWPWLAYLTSICSRTFDRRVHQYRTEHQSRSKNTL